jgi:AraC-like DNA-binding protein
MQIVGLLSTDPSTRQAVAASLQPHVRVQICLSRRRTVALIRCFEAAVVLVELRSATGETNAPFISALRLRWPRLPILGLARLRSDDVREIPIATRAGMSDLLLLGYDDPWTVLRRFAAEATDAPTLVLEALTTCAPTSVWPIFEYCLTKADAVTSANELARAFGVARRTLARQLARAGLPGPGTTLVWLRLLLATHLLEHTGWTVERVVQETGFSSVPAFRRQLRRLAGMKPSDARRCGSLAAMVWGSASLLPALKTEDTRRAFAG